MNPFCKVTDHIGRRAFLKATAIGAGGCVTGNWGGLFTSPTIAASTRRQGKSCILLWMAGGPSQMDTFDMKPGRPMAGPFRPIASSVPGIQVCEYLPKVARHVDKLAIIRSMSTTEGSHPGGTYQMHTGYRPEPQIRHPELGAVTAKYLGDPDADLPSYIQLAYEHQESFPTGGAGFLGPAYQPFRLPEGGKAPENTTPYVNPKLDKERGDLLRFLDDGFARDHKDQELQDYRLAQEKSWRLLKGKPAFNISKEWPKYRDLYGDTPFGQNCMTARQLIEAGVPFVEVCQGGYDSHLDNFDIHKGLLPSMDQGWAGLLQDLHERGRLRDTLIVWMGEFGRTPGINNRAGRDHYTKAWTAVLAGGGVKGGMTYGQTDVDCRTVTDKPVSEGDLFATIYTVLGINHKTNHRVGTRPVRLTAENATVIRDLLS
jgi:Protein of unknown function (DUF1501)